MWWILEPACIWSAGKTLTSAELENRKGLKKSDDVGNSQRRGPNRRRGNSAGQRIGFIRDSNASRRYTSSSFTRKTLRRSRVQLLLEQWSSTTSRQKWQEEFIAKCQTMNHLWFLGYPRVLPQLHLHLLLHHLHHGVPYLMSTDTPKILATQRLAYPSLSLVHRKFLYFMFTCFFNIFIAGYCDQHGKSSSHG